jgi:predicted DNA-binding transcriptional regulator AlpA
MKLKRSTRGAKCGEGSRNLLGIRQLAAALGVDRATVDGWIGQGAPSYCIGGMPRFDPDAVRAWVASRGGAVQPPLGDAAAPPADTKRPEEK